ncbi:hypothetical protein COCNU_11G002710 [Cocos nucifera]|uniref:Uncharacterized protein n=1 Tax=Cocos nucifera TaxID=13894 RepID=A0A8K0INI7_COCNU|nr:hypothetical protein COCNU_11G002710 [Cocos nucifera]
MSDLEGDDSKEKVEGGKEAKDNAEVEGEGEAELDVGEAQVDKDGGGLEVGNHSFSKQGQEKVVAGSGGGEGGGCSSKKERSLWAAQVKGVLAAQVKRQP